MPPTGLAPVRQVTVDRAGITAYVDAPDRPDCSKFRPTADQIRRFLRRARQVDPQAAHATLDRSPCQASGRVRFADGRSGRWVIEQFGVGTLTLADGRAMMLFCDHCPGPFIG